MKPPEQLKTLNYLMAQAAHYAEYCLRNSGTMAPTLFLIGDAGPMLFAAGSLTDQNQAIRLSSGLRNDS